MSTASPARPGRVPARRRPAQPVPPEHPFGGSPWLLGPPGAGQGGDSSVGETEFGPPVARTRTTRKMADKACYRNAAITAMTDLQWRYAEGMALPVGTAEGWWVHHAWNVDAGGRVLDRTWHTPGLRYLGRVIDVKQVARRISETGWMDAMRPELDAMWCGTP